MPVRSNAPDTAAAAGPRLSAYGHRRSALSIHDHPALGPLADGLKSIAGDASDSVQLMTGTGPPGSAAVVRLTPDCALVAATVALPPVVDDAGSFGAIAASHACSSVLAMGARVVLASLLCAFPDDLDESALAAMCSSAAEVIGEAGGTFGGVRILQCDGAVFGVAVQGVVHPDRVLTRGGARPDDIVVLSKPIGTGIILAGGTAEEVTRTVASMKVLNHLACSRLLEIGGDCHAVTAVSECGLLGDAHHIAEQSGACLVIDSDMVPCYRGAKQLAAAGIRSGDGSRNRSSFEPLVGIGEDVPREMEALAFDPQVSGGLLAAVDPSAVPVLVDAGFRPIGTVRVVDVDDEGYASEPMVQLV